MKRTLTSITVFVLFCTYFSPVYGQQPDMYWVTVPANAAWTNTNITLNASDNLFISAFGFVKDSETFELHTISSPNGQLEMSPNAPYPNLPDNCLVGKIGETGDEFYVGSLRQFTPVPQSGILFLGINDENLGNNEGDYVAIVIVNAPLLIQASSFDLPQSFKLQQNYPNPFNPVTSIQFTITTNDHVELTIYNLIGQRIRTLLSEKKEAGDYIINWDGRNELGKPVSSGNYIYQVKSGDVVISKKMILLR